jgi:release factor glutamine methyltransferase
MHFSPKSVRGNWPRVTDAKSTLLSAIVARGVTGREAQWILEEFAPGCDLDALVDVVAAADRRAAGEPLQYILGHWPFRQLDVDIDSRVLIPRPETEELVDVALEELARADVSAPLIVDLGCGSGVIGLSLMWELSLRGVMANLLAVDQSADALSVAKRNALKHGLVRTSFVRSDWFSDIDSSLQGKVTLIVANPPYVGATEFLALDPVLRHEPRSALVAPDCDGVEGFRDVHHIVTEAPRWLSDGGTLIVEHGYLHGVVARECATAAGFHEVRSVKDMAGHERFLVATWR